MHQSSPSANFKSHCLSISNLSCKVWSPGHCPNLLVLLLDFCPWTHFLNDVDYPVHMFNNSYSTICLKTWSSLFKNWYSIRVSLNQEHFKIWRTSNPDRKMQIKSVWPFHSISFVWTFPSLLILRNYSGRSDYVP